jgi:hypothetical protein
VILIVLLVHSCQISARNSALKDYSNNVASIVQSSDNTGAQLFNLLSGRASGTDATGVQNQINDVRVSADSQLAKARGLDVPDEVKGAQQDFVLVLRMRRDGIAGIGQEIQRALGSAAAGDAVNRIAGDMALFYGSDAVYKAYVGTGIAGALHAAGIAVGPNGQTIDPGQFLPDLGG